MEMVMKRVNCLIVNKLSLLMTALIIFTCTQDNTIKPKLNIDYGNSKFQKNKIDLQYLVASYDEDKQMFIDQITNKDINAVESALVLVDVWDKDFLSPMVKKFINPLIKDLSSLGFKIIYAPSQEPQHKDLMKVENGITFYNADTMDTFINDFKIKNLFYVGFDTLYCLIDKPNGIYSFKERIANKALNYYVFDKGVSSYNIGMREAALRLFKKNNIGVIQTSKGKYDNYKSPKINKYLNSKTIKVLPKGNNLVMIFENDKEDFNDFKNKLKDKNIQYFRVIDGQLYTQNNVLTSDYEFVDLLIKKGIDNIYYAGNYLNNEILWSKFGVINLYIHNRYMGINELPEVFFIIDLVYIAETLDVDNSLEKLIILNHYRGIKNVYSKQLVTE